jgi:hypothetical protein
VLTCVGASAVVASVADAADVVARVVDAVSDAAAPSGAAGSLDADVAEPYAAVPPSFADVGAAGPSDYAPSFADAVAAQGAAAGDAVFAQMLMCYCMCRMNGDRNRLHHRKNWRHIDDLGRRDFLVGFRVEL